ncbi:Homeodomain-like protein [Suillus fuscotomentosus]|uniref:Homeodomain-like protein n=1 Tax=Suillus fuscotomentosus TaxID=1912939 RepID=A0AAD4EGA1_9AGAM|nr:Homeodomain-like protein [Suillus fuscotomentosus]KAG1905522.1 Homeodomain-like protein [Suillus fuscotomentosus]
MNRNRQHIPDAAKQQWVTMSTHGMTSKAIAQVTGCSHRTVNRVLQLSQLTGSVVQKPLESGHPRLLTAQDFTYLISHIECTPDIFLSELQSALREVRGIEVSLATIEQMLHRHGLSHKRVCTSKLCLCI